MLPIGSTHTGDVVHTHGYIGSVKPAVKVDLAIFLESQDSASV